MNGIDDTAHFRGIEQRVDEIIEIIKSETKAGYKPTQRRGPDGKWSTTGGESTYKSERDKFEDSIRHDKKETAGVYDRFGGLMFIQGGETDFVKFSKEQRVQMVMHGMGKLRGAVLTHNHPSGRSFSLQDIRMMFLNNLSEIRAVGPIATHSMTMGKVTGFDIDDIDAALKQARDAAEKVTDKMFENRVSDSQIFYDSLNYDLIHMTMQNLVNNTEFGKKHLTYEVTKNE